MTKSYTNVSTIPVSRNSSKRSVFFNACFDKGHVKELVSWFLTTYGEKQTINFLELLKYTGFHQATKAGISLGIEDLEIPPEKPELITEAQIATHQIEQDSASGSLTSVEKSQCLIDTWNQTSDLLRQNAIQNFRNRNNVNPVYMMAFSGARGNISQVRQLVAMRGLMADPQGAILEFPIQSNFREGLTITEYLISCYGARKGLVDTALRTATSGYLTRRLVDSAQHAVIAILDCGTTRGIILEGQNFENRLVGRVLAQSLKNNINFLQNHLISINDAQLISKNYTQVLIRSPLTCEATTSVCQLCYGYNLASGKLVQIGEAVGVIAAQSIGEPGTQLTMRTFHTGGVGVFSDQALKPIFSLYPGRVVFEESIPGHFVRTPHGKIVYMIKYIQKNSNKILFRIESFSPIQKEVIIREQDLPPGSLLFVKQGEAVHSKQLLAQASHLKLTKQRLPESSHPVYSSLEGQVFFESMNLLIEKEVVNSFEDTKKIGETENFFSLQENLALPDIRRMSKIGSFWVFSAYNQQELHTNDNCFIKSGDLVSKNTVLYNYLFKINRQNQLYIVDSKLAFGIQTFQIPIEKISFRKQVYTLTVKTPNTEKIIYKKETNKKSSLVLYSNFSKLKSHLNPFGFAHISPLYFQLISSEKINSQFNSSVKKGNIFHVVPNFYSNPILKTKKQPVICYSANQFKIKFGSLKISSPFLESALNKVKHLKFKQSKFQIFSDIKKSGWVYILPKKGNSQKLSSRQFFGITDSFGSICFSKKPVSITFLAPMNLVKTLNSLDSKKIKNRHWYNLNDFTNSNFDVSKNLIISAPIKLVDVDTSLKDGVIWYQYKNKNSLLEFSEIYKINPAKRDNYQVILFQAVQEYFLPQKNQLYKKLSLFTPQVKLLNKNNSVFAKQFCSSKILNPGAQLKIRISSPTQSGYFYLKNFYRIEFNFLKNSDYSNVYSQYQFLPTNFSRGLTIFQYCFGKFKEATKFQFKTYSNNWILPNDSFSNGAIKLKTNGECRFISQKSTGTSISVLRNLDCLTFEFSNKNKLITNSIGNVIRWGDEISSNVGWEHNGQILMKTNKTITLRLGVPILASARGIVHVFQNDLVHKNQLLITLKSRRLQTEDIVQGIPKIEQLFEARESQGGEILSDTVHIRLRNAFVRELENVTSGHWSIAVEKSFIEAQQFLVENIVEAYGNQGVKISEKHVEVIVRQMTSRVRILEAGETGLLPGEIVQYTWIKKFNKHIGEMGLREATYEPIVLGISKSVLQSESFLLAASFQEVSRVLVRSALSKKRDFLRGLHENVIVGQLIPAGTGLVNQLTNPNLFLNI